MPTTFPVKTSVELGVLPTHIKFVGGLVPDDDAKLPRGSDGKLTVVSEIAKLIDLSVVPIQTIQVPAFPGVNEVDTEDLITGLRDLGLNIQIIMMVGGADPMKPEDEDAVVGMLISGLEVAKKFGISQVSSTSIEEWMQPGATPKTGADFEAAIAQNVAVHCRAYHEAGIADSCVENWHIEFLRGGEFQTFTDVLKCWEFVKAVNAELGTKFFKVLVDAAHCGDSAMSLPENEAAIAEIAAADDLGIFHASAKTTRGCLSTDDGWIGALLAAAAKTGKLKYAFVEMFHHEDAALEGLRGLEPGHGVDTTDGRTYNEVVADGLEWTGRRLNNLLSRGYLPE